MITETKKRIEWLDTTRGICAFCVLMAHTGTCPKLFLDIYTPFFLMLFFFISGFLFKTRPLLESFKKLINGLILPYFALCFIQIAIGFDNMHALTQGNFEFVLSKIKSVLLGGPLLWFVACLITVQIYFILLEYIISKINLLTKFEHFKLIIGIVLLFSSYLIRNSNYETSYWYYDTAMFALAYFTIGNYFKIKNIDSLKINGKSRIAALVIIGVFSILAVLSQKFLDVEFHVAYNYYESPLYFIMISWFGIFSVIFFCINYKIPKYINLLGQNSLLLFGFNGKTKAIILGLFQILNIDNLIGNIYIYTLVICFLQGWLIILFSKFINPYFPQIVGKKQWL